MDSLKKVFDMLHEPNMPHNVGRYKDICGGYGLYEDSTLCVVSDCNKCIYSLEDNEVLDKTYEVITKLDI